jgi:hypothetical protein
MLVSQGWGSMNTGKTFALSFSVAFGLSVLGAFWFDITGQDIAAAEARHQRRQSSAASHSSHASHSTHAASGHSNKSARHHARGSGKQTHVAAGKSSKKGKAVASAGKPKYAYPLDFFMMRAPECDHSPLDQELAAKIHHAFTRGIADDVPPEKMVRAGVFQSHALSGGIFKRREPIQYIVLHSTETGVPVPAKNVINSWNSMGRRHPGAQYVVDRDGTIYQALDPELASVHVNIFKTLPGINNDNTIGIEMNHTGRQDYPAPQRQAVMRLVTYLQNRYKVTSENVITHRYAQQGDHTDPVNFDLDNFLAAKDAFRNNAIALKRSISPAPIDEETEDDAPLASVYVQIHGVLPELNAAAEFISPKKVLSESMNHLD